MMLIQKIIRYPRKTRVLWAIPVMVALLFSFSLTVKEKVLVVDPDNESIMQAKDVKVSG